MTEVHSEPGIEIKTVERFAKIRTVHLRGGTEAEREAAGRLVERMRTLHPGIDVAADDYEAVQTAQERAERAERYPHPGPHVRPVPGSEWSGEGPRPRSWLDAASSFVRGAAQTVAANATLPDITTSSRVKRKLNTIEVRIVIPIGEVNAALRTPLALALPEAVVTAIAQQIGGEAAEAFEAWLLETLG